MNETEGKNEIKRKRGGDVKKAPAGYYTARQAQEALGMNASTFGYYVRKGKIKKFVPPLRTEGFYEKKMIDQLAREMALFLHTTEEENATQVRIARPEDAEGIEKVLTSMGWQAATAEQRRSWYKINPYIDYVVARDDEIKGYIHAVPFTEDTLEGMMSGKKRSWHVAPDDILPFEPGKVYDLYIGIATRQDDPNRTRYALRLIAGYFSFLEELAQQGVRIHHLYAVSAEVDGQKLSKRLGFIQQKAQEGDIFPRFALDFEVSDSHFAEQYREMIQKAHRNHRTSF